MVPELSIAFHNVPLKPCSNYIYGIDSGKKRGIIAMQKGGEHHGELAKGLRRYGQRPKN
jgi:hypothetical protein